VEGWVGGKGGIEEVNEGRIEWGLDGDIGGQG